MSFKLADAPIFKIPAPVRKPDVDIVAHKLLPPITDDPAEVLGDTGITSAEAHAAIDILEKLMVEDGRLVDFPVIHRFTWGLYTREIFMPAGSILTSRIHRTQHQYMILQGKAEVFIDGRGWVLVQAGDVGTTQPGTRRVLRILEDCRWITSHPNPDNILDAEKMEELIMLSHGEHLQGVVPQLEGSVI